MLVRECGDEHGFDVLVETGYSDGIVGDGDVVGIGGYGVAADGAVEAVG